MAGKYVYLWQVSMCTYGRKVCMLMAGKYEYLWQESMCTYGSKYVYLWQ